MKRREFTDFASALQFITALVMSERGKFTVEVQDDLIVVSKNDGSDAS